MTCLKPCLIRELRKNSSLRCCSMFLPQWHLLLLLVTSFQLTLAAPVYIFLCHVAITVIQRVAKALLISAPSILKYWQNNYLLRTQRYSLLSPYSLVKLSLGCLHYGNGNISNLQNFLTTSCRVFEEPGRVSLASSSLHRLRQGNSTMSQNAIQYRNLTSELFWWNKSLVFTFWDELVSRDLSTLLDELTTLATRIDNRFTERQHESESVCQPPCLAPKTSATHYYKLRNETFLWRSINAGAATIYVYIPEPKNIFWEIAQWGWENAVPRVSERG